MRITHVTSALADPLGGAEQYCLRIAIRQAERGHQVTVATPLITEGARQKLEAAGVQVRVLSVWRPYPTNRQGPNLAAKLTFHALDLVGALHSLDTLVGPSLHDEDAVHVHRFQGLGFGALRLRHPAVVHTVHDHALVDTNSSTVRRGELVDRLPLVQRIRTRVANRVLRDVGALIFPTKRILDRHVSAGLRPRQGQVHLIPHGWQLPLATARRTTTNGLCTFLFLGRLSPEKGLPLLLEAWGEGIEGARLIIGGKGAGEDRVMKLNKLGIIDYRGYLDGAAKAETFAEADVVVMPSTLAENFPLVAAEALLSGIPVLSSQISAPEFLKGGVNAVVVPTDADLLRSAMIELVQNESLRAGLKRGASAASSDLDFDRHVDHLLQVYGNVRGRSL